MQTTHLYRPLLPLSGINLFEFFLDERLDLGSLTMQIMHGAVKLPPCFGGCCIPGCQTSLQKAGHKVLKTQAAS